MRSQRLRSIAVTAATAATAAAGASAQTQRGATRLCASHASATWYRTIKSLYRRRYSGAQRLVVSLITFLCRRRRRRHRRYRRRRRNGTTSLSLLHTRPCSKFRFMLRKFRKSERTSVRNVRTYVRAYVPPVRVREYLTMEAIPGCVATRYGSSGSRNGGDSPPCFFPASRVAKLSFPI